MAIEPRKNNLDNEDEFSPQILAAFAGYPVPPLSTGFSQRFWAHWEDRRHRYRGVPGLLRRLWEIEIEGVAVWRLAASTLSGGTICALIFSVVCALVSSRNPALVPLPQPQHEIPPTEMNLYAFYRREWENEFFVPKARPKNAPPSPGRTGKAGGEFSWNGLSGQLA